MKKIHIIFIIFFSILIFSCGKDSKDKTAFEAAEKVFNDGRIAEAKELYVQFTKHFPTSQWRQTAEMQLEKCNQILELENEATKYISSEKFDQAILLYAKIASINQNAVDTSLVFEDIREKKKEKELFALNQKYLVKLDQYLTVMIWGLKGIIEYCEDQSDLSFYLDYPELYLSYLVAKVEDHLIIKQYEACKNPTPKYANLAPKIKKSYDTYEKFLTAATASWLKRYLAKKSGSDYSLDEDKDKLCPLLSELCLYIIDLIKYTPEKSRTRHVNKLEDIRKSQILK